MKVTGLARTYHVGFITLTLRLPAAEPMEEVMIESMIPARRKDLGDFEAGRVLPWTRRRMVGPFIFFDHIGPVNLPPNVPHRTDVRPHSHICLSTVTYLYDGEIVHRDSAGYY
jgi:redox-sensitive bicupin YhaK (pirin superfamily)